jgi:hypothetical protein
MSVAAGIGEFSGSGCILWTLLVKTAQATLALYYSNNTSTGHIGMILGPKVLPYTWRLWLLNLYLYWRASNSDWNGIPLDSCRLKHAGRR